MKTNSKLYFRTFCFTALVILCFSLLSCEKKCCKRNITNKPGVLTIGTEFGYPPFEYLADDGKTLIGFDVDMWNEICRRLNLKPRFYDTQWAGLFAALESNLYDCVISAVTITPERKEKFLITKPYIQNSQCFIVRRNGSVKAHEPEMLEGLKVAYQAETVSDVFVTDLVEKGLKCETFEYDKLLNAFDDLKFGRVDVVVAESVASRIIVKDNYSDFEITFTGEADAFFGILVNRNNSELFEKIQNTLDEMYADGWMKENEDKWLK